MKTIKNQRLKKLPKWAQSHIAELEKKVERAERTLPWSKPGMEWFTVLHPDTRAPSDSGKYRKLFLLGEDHANAVCSVGPRDCVFIGRGTP